MFFEAVQEKINELVEKEKRDVSTLEQHVISAQLNVLIELRDSLRHKCKGTIVDALKTVKDICPGAVKVILEPKAFGNLVHSVFNFPEGVDAHVPSIYIDGLLVTKAEGRDRKLLNEEQENATSNISTNLD